MDKIAHITDSYFYSLVKKPEVRKTRKCLKCGCETYRTTAASRLCATCNDKNSRVSPRMTDYSSQDLTDFMRDRGAI